MPLRKRAVNRWRNFNLPISYKVGAQNRLKDARNVCTIQDILETRHGISRYNTTAFNDIPLSISFFRKNNNISHLLVKDGTALYDAQAMGSHTAIKTGLTSSTKHRGVTFNNRHIFAIEGDGLFSWNGATFSQLGQAVPSAPTVAASGSGNSLTASDYQVAATLYSSSLGFETNLGAASSTVTVSSGERIDVSNIQATATNAFIDKVRIYLKDITNDGAWIFWDEINLGVTTDTIDDDPSSSQTAPTKNAAPLAGGAKFLGIFGQRLIYAGNSTFPSDVFFSEPFLPDAFDQSATSKTINVSGNGPITGLGVGYFGGDNQNPYLVIFKERHIELYTEASGSGQQVVIDQEIGCLSHDTIKTINGDIYFMSAKGWHVIRDGRLQRTKDKNDSIDNGDINDIFSRNGFVFELNKPELDNAFSVYYPTLQQYMTFVPEGGNASIFKSYNFEFAIGGFRSYEFKLNFKAACLGRDSQNEEVVYLCGAGGYIYKHSIREEVGTDVNLAGEGEAVDAFAQLYWINGDDMDASYNFGPLILRALAQDNPITVKCFLNYSLQNPIDKDFTFDDPETGFILDVSRLDEGILSDGRTIVRYTGEVLKSAQSLLIGFYKSAQGESMALIEGQLDVQKNGNPN